MRIVPLILGLVLLGTGIAANALHVNRNLLFIVNGSDGGDPPPGHSKGSVLRVPNPPTPPVPTPHSVTPCNV